MINLNDIDTERDAMIASIRKTCGMAAYAKVTGVQKRYISIIENKVDVALKYYNAVTEMQRTFFDSETRKGRYESLIFIDVEYVLFSYKTGELTYIEAIQEISDIVVGDTEF